MKKLLIVLAIGTFAACNSSSTSDTSADSTTVAPDTSMASPDTTMMTPADTTMTDTTHADSAH